MKYRFCLILWLAFFNPLKAQNADSLSKLFKTSTNDSIRVKACAELTEVCELNEIPYFSAQVLKVSSEKLRIFPLPDSTKQFYLKSSAQVLNNLGYYYENRGENDKALSFFKQSLSLYNLINDAKGMGSTYSNLGSVYDNLGDLRTAIDYYFKSLRIREVTQDDMGIGNNLHNIANLYYRQSEFENATKFSEKSLAIRTKINDKSGMAFSYNLLAQLCYEKRDTSCAIGYYLKSANLYAGLSETLFAARSNANLGKIHKLRHQFDSARAYYTEALNTYTRLGENLSSISALNNLSDIEFSTQSNNKALQFAEKAYQLSKNTAYVDGLIESTKRLSKLHAAAGNYKDAFVMFELYNGLSDSIQANSNKNTLLLSSMQYQYQKKALADSIRVDKDRKLSELKLKEEENIKIFAIILLFVCAVFLIYLFRRFKLIQKQNLIIEKQKIEVETQKQLADSRLAISESQKLIIQDSLNQLEKTQENLLKSKLEAENANASKSTFIANVSHEIRTPLNAVLGFSELLKGSTNSPKYEKYIDNILAGGKSLMLLINDILDLSKMEAGHLVFDQKPISIQSIIDDCNEWVAIKTREKGLHYELICDPKHLTTQLLLDELRIRQILFNLLGNAIKFTGKGSVQLSIVLENTTKQECVDLTFIIKDTGAGIPPDQQKSVFEAFKQVNGQTNREFGGTGLGLTITKNIVERLNGSIHLESVLGKGSVFSVTLKDVKLAMNRDKEVSRLDPSKLTFNDQSVLLVEDTALNKELVFNILESHQLSVQFASNGQEALEHLETKIPDLILMDLMMPVMDGFEAAREIRKNVKLKHIPILALSALSQAEIDPLQLRNFDGYLQKPIRVDDLIQLLSKFLTHHEHVYE